MIEMQNNKPLVQRIDEMLDCIKDLGCFYQHNEEILDIYEGNLLPYVEKLMQDTLMQMSHLESVMSRIL
jgi:hypothetical protein